MITPDNYNQLKSELRNTVETDREILNELRSDMRALRDSVRRIYPRSTTSISLVGTDGGNNQLQFDPFLVHVIRVVDSSDNEYVLEAITPTTNVTTQSQKQFNPNSSPRTALGELMAYFGVTHLTKLSHMIRMDEDGRATSTSWIYVYRELVEWAILFSILRTKDFGSDTLIVFDGLLRSKVFAGEFFKYLRLGIQEAIERHWQENRRRIYIVGIAKGSKVLIRYRLAMMLERVLMTDYPAYVEVPADIEEKTYKWGEWARRQDIEGGEANKFVAGKLFLVKFGSGTMDPIWPVDIFLPQAREAQSILGYLLADAQTGFPVPLYPMCVQKAHENASLADFDFDVLQGQIVETIREMLGDDGPTVDLFELQDTDPAKKRYD